MILTFADGKQIRGDLIKSATLRSDLSPIPLTLEAEIRAGDDGLDKRLAEGQVLNVGGDALRSVKSKPHAHNIKGMKKPSAKAGFAICASTRLGKDQS